MKDRIRKKLVVRGIVQGVGFRPFVYRLAHKLSLTGKVFNDPQGVIIEIEGMRRSVEDFQKLLRLEAPPLARITDVDAADIPAENSKIFEIVKSEESEEKRALIAPDIAVCDDCLKELLDPSDRRYRYPFINCTNCGPRFTIIRKIPYDRKHTTMSVFTMCGDCQNEYDDPMDRRFHAQPNACSKCGPDVWLAGPGGSVVACNDPIRECVKLLKDGRILAIKGIGGYHLAVDASNSEAVRRLRERKLREEKPLAVMSGSLERIEEYAVIGEDEKKLLSCPERPIVLLRKRSESNPGISAEVAPKNTHYGVMLPYTPIHHLLFKSGANFLALIMTSANLSEEPIAIANEETSLRLKGIADFFLMHNRKILLRSDDSVMLDIGGKERFMRRSRGFVPVPVFLTEEYSPVLAYGAELKNTVCILKGRNAFLSQHIGDLENMEAFNFFVEAGEHLREILEVEPVAIAYDLHPEYLNTKYAREQEGKRLIGIQHHHAHIVSCLAENGEQGPVIGLAMDGLGYGTDGTLWGGEVLIADYSGFERFMTFKNVPMPGGTAAIKEPWRMAVSFLYSAYGDNLFDLKISFIRNLDEASLGTIVKMIKQRINSPLSSGLGRIFDAASALIGIRSKVRYEGQAPFELEMAIDSSGRESPPYRYSIVQTDRAEKFNKLLDEEEERITALVPWYDDHPSFIIDLDETFREIVADIERGRSVSEMSAKFHNTVVSILAEACSMLRLEIGFDKVALSGGVFQNKYLFENLLQELKQRGFKVFTHSLVPTNDGGISLGQALIAAALLKAEARFDIL